MHACSLRIYPIELLCLFFIDNIEGVIPGILLFALTVAVVVVFTIAHVRSKRYSASAKRDSANADDNERNVTYSCGASNVTIADKSNDARPKLDTPETHLHTAVTIGAPVLMRSLQSEKQSTPSPRPHPPISYFHLPAPAFGSAVEPSKSILERSSISDKMEDKQWSALSCAERECVVPSMVKGVLLSLANFYTQ